MNVAVQAPTARMRSRLLDKGFSIVRPLISRLEERAGRIGTDAVCLGFVALVAVRRRLRHSRQERELERK